MFDKVTGETNAVSDNGVNWRYVCEVLAAFERNFGMVEFEMFSVNSWRLVLPSLIGI